MKKKKVVAKVAAASMAAMMAASLTACGGAGSSDSKEEKATGGDKEIVFWNIGTEEVDKGVYNKAIELFQESTDSGYTVTSVPIQNDTYKEKLVIAMSSGECPDMYITWSGGPMNEYIEAGYAKPITDLFNNSELPDRLMDASIEQSKYKDDIYAVPFMGVTISGIYYNTELFEKYNLEVPKTISELEKVCDTFVENGITPFALANAPKWTGSMYFMNLAARYGGLEPFQEAVAGTGSFEDDCFVEAGKTIVDWVNKGYFPEGTNSLDEDDGQARQLLYQESAAMSLAGSWYTSMMKQDSEEFLEKMSWFPFPAADDASIDSSILIGTAGENFVSFNCEGEKLEAAFECATKFSEDETVEYMLGAGKLPPIKGVESKITEKITKEIMNAVTDASSIQLWYDQYLPPAVATAHLDGCQEIFGLTMTPEDAAKKFQKAMEEYNAEKAE